MNNNKKKVNLQRFLVFIVLPILTACQSTGSTSSTDKVDWAPMPVQCMEDANAEIDKTLPTPIKRIEPKYPMRAQRNGISGCTKMLFDLTPSGQVINIRIVESWPKRVFEKSSVKSLERWAYGPTENGAKDLEVRLDYSVSR